jgi:hypothetical protein
MLHGKVRGDLHSELKKRALNFLRKTIERLIGTAKTKDCSGLLLHGIWMHKFSYNNLIAHSTR